jgi:hypothetical protein
VRDYVIYANKLNSENTGIQPQDDFIATINAHSQVVKQGNAEVAALTK